RNPGTQRLEHRVAPRNHLGPAAGVRLSGPRRALGLLRSIRVATSTLLGEALLGRLALACGVVWPVFGLGRRTPALQRLPALASGAHLWPLAPLAHGTRAGLLATALHVNSSHRGRHRTRQSAASVQCEAVGVS